MRPDVLLAQATPQPEEARLGTPDSHEGSRALLPFCYRKDFMRREENRKSKWWLKQFPELCVLSRSSRSG